MIYLATATSYTGQWLAECYPDAPNERLAIDMATKQFDADGHDWDFIEVSPMPLAQPPEEYDHDES